MEEILLKLEELKKVALLQKEVLTIDEASLYTGYTVDYLYKLIHLKEIPYRKPPKGRKLFFIKEELISWLTSNKEYSNEQLDQRAANYRIKNGF